MAHKKHFFPDITFSHLNPQKMEINIVCSVETLHEVPFKVNITAVIVRTVADNYKLQSHSKFGKDSDKSS